MHHGCGLLRALKAARTMTAEVWQRGPRSLERRPSSAGAVGKSSKEEFDTLQRDYTDATEQFAAMNEVLIALGRSSSDPDAVLDSIVESVRRLCRCEAAGIFLIEGDHFVLSSSVGFSSEYVSYVARSSIPAATAPRCSDGSRSDRAHPADPRRPHRPGVRTPGHPADRGLPNRDGGADAPGRRGRRRAVAGPHRRWTRSTIAHSLSSVRSRRRRRSSSATSTSCGLSKHAASSSLARSSSSRR